MAMRVFQLPFHVTGTLAANVTIIWTAPFDCQLIHVSAVNTAATDGIVRIGTTTDTDGYLVDSAIGDSSVPNEYDRNDFTGALITSGQYPHIAKGTVVEILVDYDGTGGTAAANLTVVLTLTEG